VNCAGTVPCNVERNEVMTDGPLAGFTVLDLSQFVAGPMTSLILAEQGADVIKVEPVGGESFRGSGATKQGVGAWWYSNNRGKRCVAIDLKREAGARSGLRIMRCAGAPHCGHLQVISRKRDSRRVNQSVIDYLTAAVGAIAPEQAARWMGPRQLCGALRPARLS
jgi:CoA-transferase family III